MGPSQAIAAPGMAKRPILTPRNRDENRRMSPATLGLKEWKRAVNRLGTSGRRSGCVSDGPPDGNPFASDRLGHPFRLLDLGGHRHHRLGRPPSLTPRGHQVDASGLQVLLLDFLEQFSLTVLTPRLLLCVDPADDRVAPGGEFLAEATVLGPSPAVTRDDLRLVPEERFVKLLPALSGIPAHELPQRPF